MSTKVHPTKSTQPGGPQTDRAERSPVFMIGVVGMLASVLVMAVCDVFAADASFSDQAQRIDGVAILVLFGSAVTAAVTRPSARWLPKRWWLTLGLILTAIGVSLIGWAQFETLKSGDPHWFAFDAVVLFPGVLVTGIGVALSPLTHDRPAAPHHGEPNDAQGAARTTAVGWIATVLGLGVLGFFWWASGIFNEWAGVHWPQDSCDGGNVNRAGIALIAVLTGAAIVLTSAIAAHNRKLRHAPLLWCASAVWVAATLVSAYYATQIGYSVSCD